MHRGDQSVEVRSVNPVVMRASTILFKDYDTWQKYRKLRATDRVLSYGASSRRQRAWFSSISSTVGPYFFFRRYSWSSRPSTRSSSLGEKSKSSRLSRMVSARS